MLAWKKQRCKKRHEPEQMKTIIFTQLLEWIRTDEPFTPLNGVCFAITDKLFLNMLKSIRSQQVSLVLFTL